jgi:integrase
MLRDRFEGTRLTAAAKAEKDRNVDLALRVREFQFRDIWPKAASEIACLEDASKLLGHANKQIMQKVYRIVGELVKPTR